MRHRSNGSAGPPQTEHFSIFPDAPDLYPFCFWKGRVALYAILRALRLAEGDQVVVGGYTCIAVPAAIRYAGAEPVYVDIDPASYNLTLSTIKIACRANPRVRAIILQHSYGMPADVAPIAAWARPQNLSVIEDCCHSYGSRYRDLSGNWRNVGTLGDASFFSSQWSKPVSTGLGGWALTASPRLALAIDEVYSRECASPSFRDSAVLALQVFGRAAMRSSRSYWFSRAAYHFLSRAGLCIGSSSEDELRGHRPPDYAKRMSEFQRKLLRRRLGEAKAAIEHRRRVTAVYEEGLGTAGLTPVSVPRHADPVFLRYPVRVGNKSDVLKKAQLHGFELGDWFDHPLHPKGSNAAAFGYQPGMCPQGELAASQVINLPTHRGITIPLAREILQFVVRTGAFDESGHHTAVETARTARFDAAL